VTERFRTRIATEADIPAISAMMERAIGELQRDFLSPDQVAASRLSMGLDTQLIADRTYVVVENDAGRIVGCGGWSYRATLYGGDASVVVRDPVRLDPTTEPARIRAMYTSPAFVRRGVGRAILQASEDAARAAGFTTAKLMATLAGVPLYERSGYWSVEEVATDPMDGVSVPLVRMRKAL